MERVWDYQQQVALRREDIQEMGWVVKKSVFSFLNALILTKIHSYSKLIYFVISIF